MRKLDARWVSGAAGVLILTAAGCGGGGAGTPAANTSAANTSAGVPIGGSTGLDNILSTGRIHVDLTTGRVSFLTGSIDNAAGSRAVLGTTSVPMSGPTQVSNTGSDPAIRTVTVTFTNNDGVDIGRLPNGAATGLRAILSGITQSGGTGPVRLTNSDGLIPREFPPGLQFLSYGPIAPGGSETRNWNLVIPLNTISFTLFITLEGATGNDATPEALSNATPSTTVAVRTVAGGSASLSGSLDGIAIEARFFNPSAIAVDSQGNVYAADTNNQMIRRISAAGVVSRVAGLPLKSGFVDGAGSIAQFAGPEGLALDSSGTVLYVADTQNNAIRRIAVTPFADPTNSANWMVSTIARPTSPVGMAIDPGGILYASDGGNRIDRFRFNGGDPSQSANWGASVLAGSGSPGTSNGTGTAASFNNPLGIACDQAGNVYVCDHNNFTIRMITPDGQVTTIAGQFGISNYLDNSTVLGSEFVGPQDCAFDPAGFLYVSDGNRIRRIDIAQPISGIGSVYPVETVAGSSIAGFTDGAGNTSRFSRPGGLAADAAGDLFVADNGNNNIRLIQRVIP